MTTPKAERSRFEKDGWSAANVLGEQAPIGLRVVECKVDGDTVTITYKLRDGWTWSDLR